MKLSMIETPIIEEPHFLEENSIQGLYPFKDCYAKFWALKARVELAIFQDHKNGEIKHEKRHTKR